jgi:hypothetical protein
MTRLSLIAVALTLIHLPAFSQDYEEKSYEDLIRELSFKKARLGKLNQNDSLAQKSMSLGLVSSYNQVSGKGLNSAALQGFEVGLINDFGTTDSEGRLNFRYFFNNSNVQSQETSLRELNLQMVKKNKASRSGQWLYGGGFSVRHLIASNTQTSLNEASIQLNAMGGWETRLSSSSALSFEGGTRFPFGVSGQDRYSFDVAVKLRTEME